MKVSKTGGSRGVSGPGRTQGRGPAKGASGPGFADSLREATATLATEAPLETTAPTAIESMLAAQEVPDATDGQARRRQVAHGHDLLDRLEDIRTGLLLGAIPKDRLAGLAQAVRNRRRESTDPRLDALLDEIELRAEVEIAKLTQRD
ncbi:MAG: flagellar assembly protein FliX [Rhodobacterales bacterium]|nr:flagellar assembly protein FliX [Rhodobacterales bacterium]